MFKSNSCSAGFRKKNSSISLNALLEVDALMSVFSQCSLTALFQKNSKFYFHTFYVFYEMNLS